MIFGIFQFTSIFQKRNKNGTNDLNSILLISPPHPQLEQMIFTESQTQNELTQSIDDFDFSQSQNQHSQQCPDSPIDPLTIPWGRLVPQAQGQKGQHVENHDASYDFLPKHALQNVGSATRSRSITARLKIDMELDLASPSATSNRSAGATTTKTKGALQLHTPPMNSKQDIDFIGLKNIKPYDRFNEYLIGRSNKCNIVAKRTMPKPHEDEKKRSVRKVIHSIISNTHCRIFCLLKSYSIADSTNGSTLDMEVYIEDSSGNGTIVNNTTLLKRNERRILHTGDTICLLNPKIVRKKVKDVVLQKELLDCYSFVFINIYQTHQQQHQQQQKHENVDEHIDGNEMNVTPFISKVGLFSDIGVHTSNLNNRKRGLVDVRSTNSRSIQRHTPLHAIGSSSAKKHPHKALRMDMPPPEKKRRISSGKVKETRTIEQEYDLREEIGSGTCGQVRRAIHRASGVVVAVKVIAIGNSGGRNRTFGVSKEGIIDPTIRAEASILQDLNHPYIVKLLDFFIHPGQAVYLVMELLHGGDLFDRIVSKGRYSEIESRRVMRRMLAAVHYLHQDRDIVHRDLKPENILCSSRSDDVTVKLTDFGLAKSITEDGLKTFCGTPLYFAPEVLRRRNTVAGSGRYGKEADMWSLGVILYILICGAPPFDANASVDDTAAASRVSFSGSIWNSTSKSAKDLILKLLTAEPSERISVVDACSHEWIMTPDGDTHAYPLDDPVVLKITGKIRSKSEEQLKTPVDKMSPPAPQSVLGSESVEESITIRQSASGDLSEYREDKSLQTSRSEVETVAEEEVDNNARRMETVSPNQSANFPTPFKHQALANRTQSKREPIFSFVKQLPIDGNNQRSNSSDEKETNNKNGQVSDDECRKLKLNSPAGAATGGDGEETERLLAQQNPRLSNTDSSTTRSSEAAASSNIQHKQKGKQTTLSSFFEKI